MQVWVVLVLIDRIGIPNEVLSRYNMPHRNIYRINHRTGRTVRQDTCDTGWVTAKKYITGGKLHSNLGYVPSFGRDAWYLGLYANKSPA